MQNTNSLLRATARLAVLALASFVLVVLGCTGAQAFPEDVSATALPVAAQAVAAPTASSSISGTSASALAPSLDKPACIPGRDKVRIEQDAISPGQALLPHQGATSAGILPKVLPLESGLLRLSGRIPAALTHLDLGIVRT